MFNFTLAESPRGLRAARGLTSLTSQSIPINRIQGIRIVQPILWRRFGWYRIDINILGYSSGEGEDNSSSATSVLLPVADAEQTRAGPEPGPGRRRPGRRRAAPLAPAARWLRWFDFWTLRYGHDDRVMITEHGWLTHVRNIVPHAKTQSVRLQQGPLQRRLGLADVHLDITRGPVTAIAHQIGRRRRPRAGPESAATGPGPPGKPTASAAGRPGDGRRRGPRRPGGAGPVRPRPRAGCIGSGGESEVFALDEGRVLRLYRSTHEAPALTAAQLRRLYDLWAATPPSGPVPFQVPRILDAGQLGGRYFTVDRRMSGRMLSGWLARAGAGRTPRGAPGLPERGRRPAAAAEPDHARSPA